MEWIRDFKKKSAKDFIVLVRECSMEEFESSIMET
jgi:hypothetical protein